MKTFSQKMYLRAILLKMLVKSGVFCYKLNRYLHVVLVVAMWK